MDIKIIESGFNTKEICVSEVRIKVVSKSGMEVTMHFAYLQLPRRHDMVNRSPWRDNR